MSGGQGHGHGGASQAGHGHGTPAHVHPEAVAHAAAVPGAGALVAAVLTVSDGVHHGVREDRSGDTLAELLAAEGFHVERRVVPDERRDIAGAIRDLAATGARVVLTTGGTGFAPRDVTPEATAPLLDRAAPGIAEAIRADALQRTPHALLSRGLAGIHGSTLVVNLPGSPGGCRDGFAVLRPALHHALELLADSRELHHRQT